MSVVPVIPHVPKHVDNHVRRMTLWSEYVSAWGMIVAFGYLTSFSVSLPIRRI